MEYLCEIYKECSPSVPVELRENYRVYLIETYTGSLMQFDDEINELVLRIIKDEKKWLSKLTIDELREHLT